MNKNVYTIGIVDDAPEELVMISLYIARLPYLQVLFDESDPMRALARMEEECPDILLLDIRMPGLDGLQLYRSLAVKPVLVICSGHQDAAYGASLLDAVAYLPKWTAYEDFEQAMQRAVARVDRDYPHDLTIDSIQVTAVQGYGAKINIPIQSILHVEVMDKVATFHCTDFDRQAKISMESLLALLPADHFVRTHKSHLVNLAKVTNYTQTKLLLHGYTGIVPIGRMYLTQIWDRLQ